MASSRVSWSRSSDRAFLNESSNLPRCVWALTRGRPDLTYVEVGARLNNLDSLVEGAFLCSGSPLPRAARRVNSSVPELILGGSRRSSRSPALLPLSFRCGVAARCGGPPSCAGVLARFGDGPLSPGWKSCGWKDSNPQPLVPLACGRSGRQERQFSLIRTTPLVPAHQSELQLVSPLVSARSQPLG